MSELVMEHKIDIYDEHRRTMMHAYRMDETECVSTLIPAASLSEARINRIQQRARELVEQVRDERKRGGIDAFMYQYDLSSDEGVALMCLAEAMLRIPDKATIDQLIQEKLSSGDWASYRGTSQSTFVNAATWGLMLTGRIYSQEKTNTNYLSNALKKFAGRAGEPVLRKAVAEGMKILAEQFVRGRTIEDALKQAPALEQLGYRYSYDMLGEAARTMEDAEQYYQAYEHAIHAIGNSQTADNVYDNAGISVKLSALHPRYEVAKRDLVLPFLIERVTELAKIARDYQLNFTIDAEEANRLSLSLDIIQAVLEDADLADWQGFGLAVQAYQKRAFYLIDWLAEMANKTNKRIMLRLVKGAYWDSEIKDSQVNGYIGYPVFTRKVSTDVSYIACAKKIIDYGDVFYPQFATHNAYSIAVILELMGNRRDFEFQCLHGMGRSLYDSLVSNLATGIRCRIYAPVGEHEDLLPYLVRRLLENGANTSFVNRIVDEELPVEDLIADPVDKLTQLKFKPHPHIPLPANIYGKYRKNSAGHDLSDILVINQLRDNIHDFVHHQWQAKPTVNKGTNKNSMQTILNPANHHQIVGKVVEADVLTVEFALQRADQAFDTWSKVSVKGRRDYLCKIAELLEENHTELMALAVREAGKTLPDALSEVREAVDFCRYYAEQGWKSLKTRSLPGPTGETNEIQMHGRGIITCISPWNFPLAIFTGQISAALMAGNVVIAKPAEQTALLAARTVALMHEAGIPDDVLQLLPGKGEIVGQALCADPRVAGVIFTGSTETARLINQTLANRVGPIATLIAETGGQNAMIVDSTALPEQVIVDVLSSAFGSAGQRCSALRVLFLQDDIADKMIAMLKGAMAEIRVGFPGLLMTDIGPVIDEQAKNQLESHVDFLNQEGTLMYRVSLNKEHNDGTFFAPCAYEIPSIGILEREVFGPILHVVRYRRQDIDKVIASINNTNYGLTLGVHTRLNSFAEYIQQHVRVGNAYVNRNMIGAVVGVQPFGGENLSGTGPKAGGPHYLPRLCTERVLTVNTAATGGNAALLALGE